MSDARQAGTVKWFRGDKGFIACDDYTEIFAHRSQIVGNCEPLKGDRVEFEIDRGRDGRSYARQIVVLK